jgi:hypothetical protein
MPADPPDTDPVDKDPRERGLQRRSRDPSITPWLAVGAIVLLGAIIYVFSAMTGS